MIFKFSAIVSKILIILMILELLNFLENFNWVFFAFCGFSDVLDFRIWRLVCIHGMISKLRTLCIAIDLYLGLTELMSPISLLRVPRTSSFHRWKFTICMIVISPGLILLHKVVIVVFVARTSHPASCMVVHVLATLLGSVCTCPNLLVPWWKAHHVVMHVLLRLLIRLLLVMIFWLNRASKQHIRSKKAWVIKLSLQNLMTTYIDAWEADTQRGHHSVAFSRTMQ